VPLYESIFEDFSNFIDGVRHAECEESRRIVRSDLSDIVSGLEVLRPKWRVIFELYHWDGLSMGEISKQFGFTESRVCQILNFSAVKIKEAIVSARLSRKTQRRRKWQESQGISFEVQDLPRIQAESFRALLGIPKENGLRMGSFKVPKISETLFRSF